MKKGIVCAVIVLLFTLSPSVAAELKLASPFTENMVLQREKPIPVWGKGKPGAEVAVSLNNNTVRAKVGKDGNWKVILPAVDKPGGPYEFTVASGNKTIKFKDVLIGEVWICSGQSNMEMSFSGYRRGPIKDAGKILSSPKDSGLRTLKIPRKAALHPQYDISNAKWQVWSRKNIKRFSVAAFCFGMKLRKELKVPVGLIQTAWGGTNCKVWSSSKVIDKFPGYKKQLDTALKKKKVKGHPRTPSVLYNAMVQPLVPLSIAGFIWYQGESNSNEPKLYETLFPEMIKDWRTIFQQGDVPFIYCQIAPFNYRQKDAGVEIREAQRVTLNKLPNLGMVVISDKATIYNIHPPDKKVVGDRFAAWALKMLYGKDVPVSGPLFTSVKYQGVKAVVSFDYAEGLHGSLKGFEIAGADGVFFPASAKIEGDKVVLENPEVKTPSAVRYCWSNTATATLFNKDNLPASSFTTATWK